MLMYLYLFFTTFYNKKKSEQKSTSVVTCATPTGQRQHCPCFKLNQNNLFFSSKVRAEHIIHMYGIIPANPVFRKAPCQRSMTKIKERVKSKYSFRSLAAKGELPHIFGGWTGQICLHNPLSVFQMLNPQIHHFHFREKVSSSCKCIRVSTSSDKEIILIYLFIFTKYSAW